MENQCPGRDSNPLDSTCHAEKADASARESGRLHVGHCAGSCESAHLRSNVVSGETTPAALSAPVVLAEPSPSVAARFWAKVQRSDGCWLWTAATKADGYGRFRLGGRMVVAHRASWFLEHRGWPAPGLDVCHRCDIRACVRPDRLFLGTHAENMADMVRKGRSTAGAANPRAKLTPADVATIRQLKGRRLSLRQVGERFGVTLSTVHLIWEGRVWKGVEAQAGDQPTDAELGIAVSPFPAPDWAAVFSPSAYALKPEALR